ncbi:MAG: xanthine dehydrogenase family protein subunit M [Streptosporangiales bacterium]|nr:xanthine dehydrogenase family protein subunit M [Streptosporangiales bacterium]
MTTTALDTPVFLRPTTLAEALAAKAAHPDAAPITGGTDIMVELNFDVRRPAVLLDLSEVAELRTWERDGDRVRVGAAVTYTRIVHELADELPGLALAARTVGSPQIRNRGTVGGNLGAASPAGDCHPPLLATGADVEVAGVRGTRLVPVAEFFTGVKRTALAADELVTAVLVPRKRGPQQFAKIGTRNAMVIAVCSFALALDTSARTVGTGIGSAGPTPLRAPQAQELAAAELPWESRDDIDVRLATRFGELVAAAARPIDDVRGTAAYRRLALAVLARRCLRWAWQEYRCA